MDEDLTDDVPLPSRSKLEALLSHVHPGNADELNSDDYAELIEAAKWALHAIPKELDFTDLCCRNPVNQVYFRAGLLACREYMARFVEQGGHADIAQSIRANWWPSLGDDPGPPRLFDFKEVCEESDGPDGHAVFKSLDVPTNIEALPRALQFLQRLDVEPAP